MNLRSPTDVVNQFSAPWTQLNSSSIISNRSEAKPHQACQDLLSLTHSGPIQLVLGLSTRIVLSKRLGGSTGLYPVASSGSSK